MERHGLLTFPGHFCKCLVTCLELCRFVPTYRFLSSTPQLRGTYPVLLLTISKFDAPMTSSHNVDEIDL